MSKNMVTVEL